MLRSLCRITLAGFVTLVPDAVGASDLDAVLRVGRTIVRRSVLSPVELYNGIPFRVTTSEGTFERKRFYGAAMVLKYVTDPPRAFAGRRLEERLECIYEKYPTGLPAHSSALFSADERGVWSDVLVFGAAVRLPEGTERILRQELLLDGKVFSVNTIIFRQDRIEFYARDPSRIANLRRKLDEYRRRTQAAE